MDAQNCFPVIFLNVKESYSPDDIISCQFSIKDITGIKKDSSNCFVGIFVVAWESLDNAIVKRSFTSLELEGDNSGGIYNLNFDSKETVSSKFEDDEFYQFCFYNIMTNDVLGASTPFQICDDFFVKEDGSLIHIEDSSSSALLYSTNKVENEASWWLKGDKPVDEDVDDTVLIHNKTTLMEDAIVNATKVKEEALATKEKFENELEQFTAEKKETIRKFESEVNQLKQLNTSLSERESMLKQQLIDSKSVIRQMENFAAENSKKTDIMLHNVTIEKEALVKALSDQETVNIEDINNMKCDLNAKITASEVTCDNLNKCLVVQKKELEKMQMEYEDIIFNLKKEIELLDIKENESATETSKNLTVLQERLNAEITQKYEFMNEIDTLSQLIEKLTDENKLKDSLLNSEREKLAALSVQQEEMTSRFTSENEKICVEIKNLKSHENNLVDAHQKELTCHRNRVAAMELISKEEKLKFENEIDILNNDLNDKINCINILEARIRENEENNLNIEHLKQEKLDLTDIIDELNAKFGHLQQENLQLPDECKQVYPEKSTGSGSMHALHVANAHMQKQLNSLKKEKEIHNTNAYADIIKDNEEYKLRLCMGRKAFDKQYLECQKLRNELNKLKNSSVSNVTKDSVSEDKYNSLLLEYNNSKANHADRVDELLATIQDLKTKRNDVENERVIATADKDNAIKLNEELRVKLLQLVDHYEGKINLLTEENGMLKIQRTALMQAGNMEVRQSSPDIVQTVSSVTCEQPNLIQMNRDMIPKVESKTRNLLDHKDDSSNPNKVVNCQPDIGHCSPITKCANEKVVAKQPMLQNIKYPPSMRPKALILPNEPQEISRSPNTEVAVPQIPQASPVDITTPEPISDPLISAEPPSQVIPNRIRTESASEQLVTNAYGRLASSSTPVYTDPALQCPICALDFPLNFTEGAKTEHVNSHFE